MRFKYPQFFVLLVFIVPMLACNSFFGSDDEPQSSSPSNSEPDSSLAVTADSEATTDESASSDSEPAADGAASATSIQPSLAIDADGLPFQTYRAEIVMSTTSNDDVATMTLVTQRDIPNQAMSYEVSAIGVPDMEEFSDGTMSIVSIGETVYIPFEGECMAMNAGGQTPMDQFLNGGEFFDNSNLDVAFIADETMLGLPVRAYSVTGLDEIDFANAEGQVSVYTTEDGRDIVLKAEMTGTSSTNPVTEAQADTTISYSFSVTDADTPVEITIPAGCENAMQMPNIGNLGALGDSGTTTDIDTDTGAGAGSDAASGSSNGQLPSYPGAEFLANVAGIQSFMIPQSAIDAAQISPRDFFVDAFTEQGFTIGQEFSAGPSTTINFEGGGSNVQLIIADEGSDVTVTIMGLP